jgi:triosephosphate isomerase
MRTPLIAGNWKMNTTLAEAKALAEELLPQLDPLKGVEKLVCPPFVSLPSVAHVLRGSTIRVGAQNMHHEAKGAFTGEVAPGMLKGFADYVILGHSERRQYFHEDDSLINKKVLAALANGLKPILCVGERLEEREGGKTEERISRQVTGGLTNVPANEALVVAYEPIWAIGTGRAATGATANETTGLIRRLLAAQYGNPFAQKVRILYGGSVTPQNIAEFMGQPEIDGGLVGGASLKAGDFAALTRLAAEAKR